MSIPSRNRFDVRDAGTFKISSAEREVRRAIDDLKESQKAAYIQALEQAPDLVAAESRVDRFLRREKSNVAAAAKLQALYWKDRKSLFQDRAFLPLDDLSGNGALTMDDIEQIKQGFILRLTDDTQGRPSLLIDLSKARAFDLTGLTRMRCLFYWLSVQIAQNPKAQTDGFNMITIQKTPTVDRKILVKMWKLIQRSMPVRIHSSHICVLPPAETRQQYLNQIMPALAEVSSTIKCTRNKIHTTEEKRDILRELEVDGIPASSVPEVLGGSWGYETFDTWFGLQRKGTNVELFCAAALAANDGDEKMPAIDDTLVEASRVARAQERKERKRQLDVIYARKRREREKEDSEGLQEQCYRLNQANVALKEQGEKLERLLGEARRMVEVLEATQVPQNVVQQPQAATNPFAAAAANISSSYAGNVDQSQLGHQLLQQLLLASLPQASTPASMSSQCQPVTGSPTSEVLLQLLTLSSMNSNPTNANNVMSALQQVTPALAMLQANRQSQDVLTNILCQVVSLLEQQNQPPQVSPNVTTKLTQLLPLIQQFQTQQLQAQKVQSPQMQAQQIQIPQTQATQIPFQQQPQQAQSQQIQLDPSEVQEQLLRLLQNAGLR